MLSDGGAPVEHHARALVRHAELVGIHAHAGHSGNGEIEGGDGIPQRAREGEDEAAEARVHVARHTSLASHLR